MTRPKREHQPDRFVAGDHPACVPADGTPATCPCHWWPDVREAARCCQMAGMCDVAGEKAYIPWPDQSQP